MFFLKYFSVCISPTRGVSEDGYISHPDHLAAGEAALSAAFPAARDRLTFPELLQEGLEPHKVREVWIMYHEDAADMYVDVTEYMDIAVAALKEHKTQVTAEEAENEMKGWRRNTATKVGFEYAEAFKVIHLA